MRPITTEDGSPTYLHPAHGASYRSLKGAATESRYVFFEGSRLAERGQEWRVLELGFGTGMNFQTTAEAAANQGVTLHFHSLEPDPLEPSLWLVDQGWQDLHYGREKRFGQTHLTVYKTHWQDHAPPKNWYDAVFHDPFGPSTSPECWTAECFGWALSALKSDGVLATFGAAGATRRAMKEAGFLVGVLPGAPGKREMTVASASADSIDHAKPWKRS